MMNPIRVTIVLTVMVVALAAYILLIDIPESRKIEQQHTQERKVLPFDDRAITEIHWHSPTETIRLQRDDRYRWTIVQPLQFPADNRQVRSILRALTIGKIKRTIENGPSQLKTYGLEPPYLTLTLHTPSESRKLAFGDAGPFAPSLYLHLPSANQVVLTTLDVMTFAHKTLTHFRRKDLFSFDRERVMELHIQNQTSNLVLKRVAGVHSLTPNWAFTSPVTSPADTTSVGTLLMDLHSLAATGFVDDEQDKRQILSQPPTAQVSVQIYEGAKTHPLALYQFEDREKAYAVTTAQGPLYEIPGAIIQPLTQGLFYFQNKRLFGMEVDEITMVEVISSQEHYLLIKQHNQWTLDQDPRQDLNQEIIKLFVSRLVDLPAELALPDPMIEDQVLGFDSPSLVIKGRNQRGQVQGQLILGKREKGLVFAKGSGLSGVFQARSTILNQIPSRDQLLAGPPPQ